MIYNFFLIRFLNLQFSFIPNFRSSPGGGSKILRLLPVMAL